MRLLICGLVASTSALALNSAAFAQAGPAAEPVAPVTSLEEVVVTARRRSESLQDVPQAVSAVGGETLAKLNIQRFEDVQAVVPGLTLSNNGTGFQAGASLRGVSFDAGSAANPTVALYLNDAPVDTTFLFQSLFDLGQVEVLRGPQGTTRGIAAPSGAITITTRQPDLHEFGGYASGTITDQDGRNLQGGVNIPLINDKLALRVAGLWDKTNFNGVESLNNSANPFTETKAIRTSLAFQPTDTLRASLMYQHLERDQRSYEEVFGPGLIGNGPALAAGSRKSVQDGATTLLQKTDALTAKVDWDVAGHTISYVGSYGRSTMTSAQAQDLGNLIPNFEVYQSIDTLSKRNTHELRVSSTPAAGKHFDYTFGIFHQATNSSSESNLIGAYLPGAFGPPGTFDPAAYNSRYVVPISVLASGDPGETSFFANLMVHLGPDTELAAGVRRIKADQSAGSVLAQGSGFIAIPLAFPCAFAGFANSAYAGACEVPIPGSVLQDIRNDRKENPTIYSFSASHKFNRDLLVYANGGTSWRPGPMQVGIFNAANDPALNSLMFLQPETSRSAELGVKYTFADGRGRLNVAAFHQTYKDLIFRTKRIPQMQTNPAPSVSVYNLTANADAIIDGFDIDAAFRISPNWRISGAVSYADGHIDNDSAPCFDGNFDGIPDTIIPTVADFQAAGTAVAFCTTSSSVSLSPPWTANLTSEYTRQVGANLDGFVRVLFNYAAKNNRQSDARVIDGYALVNLFAGVQSQDGAWEVSLFAKNLFNDDTILNEVSAGAIAPGFSSFPADVPVRSDYYPVTAQRPREVGLSLRYAFGSR